MDRNTVVGMIFRRRARFFVLNPRVAAGFLALTGVVISSFGIILVPQPSRTASGPYPCQGGTCGCATAERCWRSCRCTTLTERLRWANENGVTPPNFVLLQLATEGAQAKSKPRACCSTSHDQSKPVACETRAEVTAPVDMVLLESVNRCRGLAAYVAIFGAATCEAIPQLPQVEHLLSECLPITDIMMGSCSQSPPTPPPRVIV